MTTCPICDGTDCPGRDPVFLCQALAHIQYPQHRPKNATVKLLRDIAEEIATASPLQWMALHQIDAAAEYEKRVMKLLYRIGKAIGDEEEPLPLAPKEPPHV
jgi:hypothetical protein